MIPFVTTLVRRDRDGAILRIARVLPHRARGNTEESPVARMAQFTWVGDSLAGQWPLASAVVDPLCATLVRPPINLECS